jgi:hypothetical protein
MPLSHDPSALSHQAARSAVDGTAEGTNSAQGTGHAMRRALLGVSTDENKGPPRAGRSTPYPSTELTPFSRFTSPPVLAYGACLLAILLILTAAVAADASNYLPSVTTTTSKTKKPSSPPSSEEAPSGGFRLTTVEVGVATATIAALMVVIALRTLKINRGTFQITRAKEDRERKAQQSEDPSVRQRIRREADASFEYLKATLARIITNVMELSQHHLDVDPDEKHSLVLDEYFFSLPLTHERYNTVLEELLKNRDTAAGYVEEIRSRLETLSKTTWRLNDFDVPGALDEVDDLTRRLEHPEDLFPSEVSRLAANAYDAVEALLS